MSEWKWIGITGHDQDGGEADIEVQYRLNGSAEMDVKIDDSSISRNGMWVGCYEDEAIEQIKEELEL